MASGNVATLFWQPPACKVPEMCGKLFEIGEFGATLEATVDRVVL